MFSLESWIPPALLLSIDCAAGWVVLLWAVLREDTPIHYSNYYLQQESGGDDDEEGRVSARDSY